MIYSPLFLFFKKYIPCEESSASKLWFTIHSKCVLRDCSNRAKGRIWWNLKPINNKCGHTKNERLLLWTDKNVSIHTQQETLLMVNFWKIVLKLELDLIVNIKLDIKSNAIWQDKGSRNNAAKKKCSIFEDLYLHKSLLIKKMKSK